MAFSREKAFTGQVLERGTRHSESPPALEPPQSVPLSERKGSQLQGPDGLQGIDSAANFAVNDQGEVAAGVGVVTERMEGAGQRGDGGDKGGEGTRGRDGRDGDVAAASRKPSKFKQKMMGLE